MEVADVGLSKRVAFAMATIVPIMAFGVASVGSVAIAATCASRVPSDINGDGLADLVVGEPNHPFPDATDVSRSGVRVLYGTASGPSSAGNQFFDDVSTGVGGDLGVSVTTGYFNDDCFADVAAGASSEREALVLYGSAAGLSAANSLVISGDTVAGLQAYGFGTSTTAGDFDGDGLDDLAVGTPTINAGGGVGIIYGAAAGLNPARTQWITQDTAGVPGAAEFGDLFGFSVAAGDFTGDRRADLAIGSPGEDIGSTMLDAGSLTVLPGSATGVNPAGKFWSQDSSGVPGAAERADQFGFSLAVGDINGDHKAELAVGANGETIGSGAVYARSAGMVTVFRFGANLAASGFQAFTQDTAGVPGAAETNDQFGNAVAFGDFNGDGRADLAVASVGEDIGSAPNAFDSAGMVTVLYARTTTLTTSGAKAFSQSTAGVPGANETGDQFGYWVSAMRHGNSARAELVVGVAGEDVGAFTDCGAVVILRGGASGLTGSGSTAFYPSALVSGAVNGGMFGAATA
jgi:FG-GAP repeat